MQPAAGTLQASAITALPVRATSFDRMARHAALLATKLIAEDDGFQMGSEIAVPVPRVAGERLARMGEELKWAWAHTDGSVLQRWAAETGQDFGRSVSRRVKSVGRSMQLLYQLLKHGNAEAKKAAAEGRANEHLKESAVNALSSVKALARDIGKRADRLLQALRTDPATAGPQLFTAVVVSLLVSGGPDGDGGAPDLDLAIGIGEHRSIWTHSILMGATLETAVLALLRLTRTIHAQLPQEHDPLWDKMAMQSEGILAAANRGAGIGLAYHLMVDGLLQPAPYHGMGIAMPLEAHQAIMATNALAEAVDVAHKPGLEPTGTSSLLEPEQEVRSRGEQAALPLLESGSKDPQIHLAALRTPFTVREDVRVRFDDEELAKLRRYGTWLQGLHECRLAPTTEAQRQFVQAVRHGVEASAPLEVLWLDYLRTVAYLDSIEEAKAKTRESSSEGAETRLHS